MKGEEGQASLSEIEKHYQEVPQDLVVIRELTPPDSGKTTYTTNMHFFLSPVPEKSVGWKSCRDGETKSRPSFPRARDTKVRTLRARRAGPRRAGQSRQTRGGV